MTHERLIELLELHNRKNELELRYGYKQEYIAFKLGIEQSNYCLREQGISNWKDEEIEILKELFKIEIREEKL